MQPCGDGTVAVETEPRQFRIAAGTDRLMRQIVASSSAPCTTQDRHYALGWPLKIVRVEGEPDSAGDGARGRRAADARTEQ